MENLQIRRIAVEANDGKLKDGILVSYSGAEVALTEGTARDINPVALTKMLQARRGHLGARELFSDIAATLDY